MAAKRSGIPSSLSSFGLVEALLVFSASFLLHILAEPGSVLRGFVISLIAALVAGAGAAWVARRRQRRINQLVRVSEAWLRGNLALRSEAIGQDDLARLTRQLNQLAEHLEEDEQDLERMHESNTRLTDQVRALAVVEERNRLARELHDSVKQHLFSLGMTASAVRTYFGRLSGLDKEMPAELAEMVHEIERAAQAAQRETTRLIEDLRPAPLQERGLVAALNDYTLIFGARQHLLVYLDVTCSDRLLPAVVSEALYRVTQEALHNVARHADATRVDVSLHCDSRRVALTIEDNGVGFDTARTRRGLGISSMQERLIANGGRLTVDSRPGSGTTVRAEIDIQATPSAAVAGDITRRRVSSGDTFEPQPHAASLGRRQHVAPLVSVEFQPPRPEAWAWLGERLVIPVGQVWPWLPVDQKNHLRHPVIKAGEHALRREQRLFGLRQATALLSADGSQTLVRIVPDRNGYRWDVSGADWALRRVRGLRGRAVLERKGQVLAAMQYRGRQMDMWTEIVYDDRMYRLEYGEGESADFVLRDAHGAAVLAATRLLQGAGTGDNAEALITASRGVPLPLGAMTIARILDEAEMKEVTEPA